MSIHRRLAAKGQATSRLLNLGRANVREEYLKRRRKNALFGQVCKRCSIILGWVASGVHEGVRHGTHVTSSFVIAEVVEEEDDIHEVTTGPEPFEGRVWVRVCGKEFGGRSGEAIQFHGGKNTETFGPCPGLWNDSVVVGIGSRREGTDPLEVWESEVHAWADAQPRNWGQNLYLGTFIHSGHTPAGQINVVRQENHLFSHSFER